MFVYFNPYCNCFDVICNEEYVFIYTYQSCYRNLCFPKDEISTIKQTQCILRRRERLTRGQFSTHKLQCLASFTVVSIHRTKYFVQKAMSYPHLTCKETEAGRCHTLL